MRNKLDRRGVWDRAVAPTGWRARAWPARLLRIRVPLVAIAVVAAAGWVGGRLVCGAAGSPCGAAFAAERWDAAAAVCARDAERTGDPTAGVRAAAALLRLDRLDDALRAAERWFGSREDATARQVAGAVHFDRLDLPPAIALLEVALAGHVARLDHAGAARDASYLAGAFTYGGLLGDALDAAGAAVREADLAGAAPAIAQLRGRARRTLGKLLTEVGDFATARTLLWEAQQALSPWPADQAWVFLQLGLLLQAIADHASAATLFERALELAGSAAVAQVATAARMNLVRERLELGQIDEAARQLDQVEPAQRARSSALVLEGLIADARGEPVRAAQLLERAAEDPSSDDAAMDIAVQRGRLAERAGDLAAAERHYRAAIESVEAVRRNARSLALRPLILARRRAPYRDLLALLARQQRPGEALAVAEQLHARSWLDALVGHSGATSPRAQVASAQALRRLDARAAAAPSVAELAAMTRGRELLVFARTDAALWRFHLIDGAVAALDRLPDGAAMQIDRWRRAPGDRALAGELGELLIPPAARAPAARPLHIVTDGALDTAPLAALRVAGQFLIERRAIVRLPGIAALRCPARGPARGPAVLLGDSRDDLPAARREIRELAARLGGAAQVGAAATAAQLAASRDAALLHLAVHAEIDRAGARLVLADRAVTAADIVEQRIAPAVAVLAGCATAASGDAEGWGALSSAFLAAGSRAVIATLRSVADADALDVMQRFYRLGGDRHPALALALAQRELVTGDPAVWAAFVAYGSADAADCDAAP